MTENNGPTGHPMHEIAEQFEASAEPSQEAPAGESGAVVDSHESPDTTTTGVDSNQDSPPTWGPLSLSADQIGPPAFFVDGQLAVRWVAPDSTDALSQALDREMNSQATPNIFSLLLSPAVKHALADWQTLFSFVYVILRRSAPKDIFEAATDTISGHQYPRVEKDTATGYAPHPFQADSRVLAQANAGGQLPQRIFGLGFNGGTLFLLRQDPWQVPATTGGQTHPLPGTTDRSDQKASICMLSMQLNDSHRIADTMLPDVYFNMMNLIWDEVDDIVTALGGRRTGCSGTQIHYVFKPQAGRNPIFSAISCATRLNERMDAFEKRVSVEHGWADEIRMNMGISHGKDDLNAPAADESMAFMIPGGAFDQATVLSTVAAKGEVWITKNAVAQLPKRLIDQVVLGVERQGSFRRNFFTRIADLPQDNLPDQPIPDLGALAIARVLEIEKQ